MRTGRINHKDLTVITLTKKQSRKIRLSQIFVQRVTTAGIIHCYPLNFIIVALLLMTNYPLYGHQLNRLKNRNVVIEENMKEI